MLPTTPYHGVRDDLQVNRFLDPMKKYEGESEDVIEVSKMTPAPGVTTDIFEYDNMKYLYGNEHEHSIHNALKQRAISCSHELLLDPKTIPKRDAFVQSQYKLRQWRGKYIAENVRRENHPTPFGLKLETGVNYERKITNLVEFTCTENKKPTIPVPLIAKVDGDLDVFNLPNGQLKLHHIVDIIGDAHDRILKQYKQPNKIKEILDTIFRKIKEHAAGPAGRDNYFIGANADKWDDTARKATASGGFKAIQFHSHGEETTFDFRCGINIIIPTKVKMEHNVKTVHRFALDFSKILKTMHLDLVVQVHSGPESGKEFVWTINRFEQNKHQIFQAGYMSEDNRLFEMPKTLEEMTIKHADEKYDDKFFRKATIESTCIDKNDYSSLLNLHVFLTHSKLHEMKVLDTSGPKVGIEPGQSDDESHYTDVGYIYKYNHYTIIASGIRHKSHDTTQSMGSGPQYIYSNFYTIIHWNNSPAFHSFALNSTTQPLISKTDQIDLKAIYDYVRGVNAQVGNLVAQRIVLPEAALSKVDLFIPSILQSKVHSAAEEGSGGSIPVHSGAYVGVFYISECTKEDRDMISMYRKRMETRMLRELYNINPRQEESVMNVMIEQMKSVFFDGKDVKVPPVPGYFGKYLQLTQNNAELARRDDKRWNDVTSGLEVWSNFWHDFFDSRPDLKAKLRWLEEKSYEMRKVNAQHEDRAVKLSMQRHRQQNGTANNHGGGSYRPRQSNWNGGGQRMQQPRPVTNGRNHTYGQVQFVPQRYSRYAQPNMLHPWSQQKQMDSAYPKTKSNSGSLAVTVESPEFVPQAKLQAEIDSLKRTLNELTLRTPVDQ
jgi:hypothetical protein